MWSLYIWHNLKKRRLLCKEKKVNVLIVFQNLVSNKLSTPLPRSDDRVTAVYLKKLTFTLCEKQHVVTTEPIDF